MKFILVAMILVVNVYSYPCQMLEISPQSKSDRSRYLALDTSNGYPMYILMPEIALSGLGSRNYPYLKRKWDEFQSWGKRADWNKLNSWGRRKRSLIFNKSSNKNFPGESNIGSSFLLQPWTKKEKWTALSSWGKRDSDAENKGMLLVLNMPYKNLDYDDQSPHMINIDENNNLKRGWNSLNSWGKRVKDPQMEMGNNDNGNNLWEKRPDDWREFHTWGKRKF
ncbi:unnamed protein product [Gordionus sp. m RMFG-2023]|uniref:prothoracicostatic peptide-like n=1 Tax=Gordionus sp. m RMFG-2023 TaxID=3053472 RepID=UPI0030E5B810